MNNDPDKVGLSAFPLRSFRVAGVPSIDLPRTAVYF